MTATAPPGPRLPDLVQAVLVMRYRPTFMARLRRRYGPVFRVRMPYGPHGSMVTVIGLTEAEHIRQVFAGPITTFHAGEGNSALLDVMGEHSLLLLDEAAHVRARSLIMPAFTARALAGYRELVRDLARAEIRTWTDGRLRALDPMHLITLEVILQVVFGVTDPARLERMRPLVRRVADVDLFALLAWRYPRLQRYRPWRTIAEAQRDLDALLYAEIAERRTMDLTGRSDLLSRMVAVEESGDRLTDAELRDQLVTFLLAGHDTTATVLAWVLHECAHRPEVLARARAAAEIPDGDAVLEAIVKETMRLHPVVFNATRTLTEEVELAGYRIPAGHVVSPVLGLVGVDPAKHPNVADFDLERFLGRSPEQNTWIPFGGGPRRCIGAAFSLMEAVEVLREVLLAVDVAPNGGPEEIRPRGIINEPNRGGDLVVTRRQAGS